MLMKSKEEIAKRLEDLLGLDEWNKSNEQEYNDLIEAYPVENDNDKEYLLDIGEMAFLKLVTPKP